MRIQDRTDHVAKKILTAMVVNKNVLGTIAHNWEKHGLFTSRWANLIGEWCVQHFKKFGKPPGKNIATVFDRWANKKSQDKEAVERIESFLAALSREHTRAKDIQEAYVIDLAGQYFNKARLKTMFEQGMALLDNDQVDEASTLLEKRKPIEMGIGSVVDVLGDGTAVDTMFANPVESLIKYKGALGNLFGPHFARESFVVFEGPEKRGKSFWLMDVAWRGATQGKNVLLLAVGDMTQNQMMNRICRRFCKRPLEKTDPEKPVNYPITIMASSDGKMPEVSHAPKQFKRSLTKEEVQLLRQKVHKKYGSRLKLTVYPNNAITVNGIRRVLDQLERQDWVPDVVVIDYIDLLAPINGTAETRDQINATWKELSALRQERKCCIVGATQTNAASYKSETLSMANFSEDKRKNAHATCIIGLNQNDEEKKIGLMRLNIIALREGEFSPDKCVYVAGCLPIANPAIQSSY